MQGMDDLLKLVTDRHFEEHVKERSFQIYLHERLPAYWILQYELLVAVKYIFDRIKPKKATVIFPNRTLRFPRADAEVLLELINVGNAQQGIQVWVEYLAQIGRVQFEGQDWKAAFNWTREGYRLCCIQVCDDDNHHSIGAATTLQIKIRRTVIEEMSNLIERAWNDFQVYGTMDETMKNTINEKARDLLALYMEPVPLDFAVQNYENLMKTSYKAGPCLRLIDVVVRALVDAEIQGCPSEVKIVIVEGITQTRSSSVLKPEVKNVEHKDLRETKTAGSVVTFAGLPGTGSSIVWQTIECRSCSKDFCDYIELPAYIGQQSLSTFIRTLLLH